MYICNTCTNLLSSAWCFWIVHECIYRVQAKDGFQFLGVDGQFSKIQSLMVALYFKLTVMISACTREGMIMLRSIDGLPSKNQVLCEYCTHMYK